MKTYLVGGAVRDELLSYPIYEHDYVVVGATPNEMTQKGFTPVGKDFPVFLHPETKDEYALARTERKSGHGYQGFTFNTDTSVTLEEDLIRRDLTINAIAKSDTGDFIDPYNGKKDIENKVFRHVSDAFREDPVRILRVARFMARYAHLGFTVADETIHLMRMMVENGEANYLVAERVWKEFSRALTERAPETFIHTLHQCGALKVVMPEIHEMLCNNTDIMQTPALQALQHACKHTQSAHIRFASLIHDLSTHKNTDINSLSQRLCLPNEYSDLSRLTISLLPIFIKNGIFDASDVQTIINKSDAIRKPQRFYDFLYTCQLCAQTLGSENTLDKKEILATCLERINLISPQDLIQKGFSGKALGEALQKERYNVIEKALATK